MSRSQKSFAPGEDRIVIEREVFVDDESKTTLTFHNRANDRRVDVTISSALENYREKAKMRALRDLWKMEPGDGY